MSTSNTSASTITITYDDRNVRRFMNASIFWGIIGMLVGVIAASQLSWWQMNGKFLEWISFGLIKAEGIQYITFGRLRPLHTNAVIFAFVGNMMFAGIYYSTQRLCKCRTASDLLTGIHFWGWQLIIVAAAISLPAGLTRGKEYAELIWPINIAVALIWVVFAINFFWTLAKRNEPSLYVAIWFYIATIITVAMLYIVNHLSIPTSILHSYPIFGGVQDALVQWWYGHNAVAFFLTTPILGIMYYFLPKAANRPVYSYRLSIIHFWSLVFIYIWAGPHHLLNTALPYWLQLLGMLFSLMLWAPSWGGMLNGLLTLRGAWSKLRTDPVIKFFAAGVTFYGMATFEGPLLSIRVVNELSHYSDWTIGHVHSGALGWNGFMAAGMFYWLAPKLWKGGLWSKSWANMHFWLGLVGILLYVASMWVAGITQGLMLGQTNDAGTVYNYEFVETLKTINIFYIFRTLGGTLYLIGFLLCVVNIWMTSRSGIREEATAEVAPRPASMKKGFRLGESFLATPLVDVGLGISLFIAWFFLPPHADLIALGFGIAVSIRGVINFRRNATGWINWHDRLLENHVPFTTLIFVSVAIGGAVQIIPNVLVNKSENVEDRIQKLYTPLELDGRDIYVAEGCYNCHSQMIRMLPTDVLRYGDYSRLGETLYDHPFQWGSKRTGPDLAREGGIRGDLWHFQHFLNPRQTSPGSNMPPYPWLFTESTDFKSLPNKIKVQRMVGVPYPAMDKHEIEQGALDQATEIAKGLVEGQVFLEGTETMSPEELTTHLAKLKIIPLIAYVQKLGAYEEAKPEDRLNPVPLDPDRRREHLLTPPEEEKLTSTELR